MNPSIRAAADRYMLETANVKYIAEYLPRGATKRKIGDTDRTVGETIGHIALSLGESAALLREVPRGSSPVKIDPEANWAAHARAATRWRPKDLVTHLDQGLVAIHEVLATMAEGETAPPADVLHQVLDVTHLGAHGLEIAESVEELRFDPMVLNWLLYVDFADRPDLFQRQRRLYEDARDYFREQGEDEEEDEEED